ncbi:MBT domain-containing protein 1-like isoform X1 [Argopecten irradians]|uniref:MBT domain-containing protein 1-like isoform X1 n=1 Tax=Argopecten irradians TaxID=31199 RepID=UPI00371497F1
MDQTDTDWGGWSVPGQVDGDSFQKHEDSNHSLADARSDSVYDSSNMGGEDDYMSNLGLYDGYDSYNEMSGSSSDDDGENEKPGYGNYNFQATGQSTPFRFINGKDGMATCERCGAVGIKHAFYSKSKRFCSLSCSRSFATAQREGKPNSKEPAAPQKKIPGKKLNSPGKQTTQPIKQTSWPKTITSRIGGVRGFDWGPYLSSTSSDAASVSCFRHCPMSDNWLNITVGMKVEIQNHECDLPDHAYWIATVVKIAGYKSLMRFEGFGSDSSSDFWMNLCTQDVHPVGWCATIGKPLVPPKSIQHKYLDWKEYLVKRLTGSRTLPSNFYTKVVESIGNHRFRKGVHVEVVDKMCVSAMRVATVDEVIGGRLRLQYVDSKEENDDFWCHMRSPLVHPVTWSQRSGHKLHASQEYKNQCLNKIITENYHQNDAVPDMFHTGKEPQGDLRFQVGMKLEAIDPLNLSAICVATVMKVLKNNYLMIGIDGSMAQNGSDWFCYHTSSPCIFPVGFCEVNGLDLTPPRGYKGQFKWFEYLKQSKSTAAPVKLFDKEIPKHGFKPGHKVEAVDLMEPRLICVATVSKVVGRLLRIHFDGWENEYDQWVDSESPDLYPAGWCEVMNYGLEGPRVKVEPPAPIPPVPKPNKSADSHSKKRKGKTQIYKGPRKSKSTKRKPKLIPGSTMLDIHRDLQNNDRASGFLSFGSRTRSAHSEPNTLPPLDEGRTGSVKFKQEIDDSSSTADGPPTLSPHAPGGAVIENIKTEPMDTSPAPPPTTGLAYTKTALSNLLLSKSPLRGSSSDLAKVINASPLAHVMTSESGKSGSSDMKKPSSPSSWTVGDVNHFLRDQDCGAQCDSFTKLNIDGKKLLELTREQLVSLTGMKVGASLKIYDLIQNLKNSSRVTSS